MTESSADALDEFHNRLRLVWRSGLPLHLLCSAEAGSEESPAGDGLADIETRLRRRLLEGHSLQQAAVSEPGLSPDYRSSLLAWLDSDGAAASLDWLTDAASVARQDRTTAMASWILPLIWILLACLAFTTLCFFTIPGVLKLSQTMRVQPGYALRTMLFVGDWAFLWLPAVALGVVTLVWRGCRKPQLSAHAHRSSNNSGQAMGIAAWHARLSQQAAELGDQEHLPQQWLASHLGLASRGEISDSTGTHNDSIDQHPAETADKSHIALPPLMGWATDKAGSMPTVQRRLRIASRLYEGLSCVRPRSRSSRPPFASIVFGGGLILLVGLGAFLPLIQLLLAITEPVAR